MKSNIILSKYILFVYTEYIKEEWECYTSIGRKFIYPLWVVRSIIIWLISPIFIPEYFIVNSKWIKNFNKNVQRMQKQKINHNLNDIDYYNKNKKKI
jgi:hypothetical protein